MTDKQANFIKLAKEYESLSAQIKDIIEKLNASMLELPLDSYIQDPDSMAVYKIVKPKGTFMYYKDVDYIRTVLEGESRGSLSKKEATEAGFTLSK